MLLGNLFEEQDLDFVRCDPTIFWLGKNISLKSYFVRSAGAGGSFVLPGDTSTSSLLLLRLLSDPLEDRTCFAVAENGKILVDKSEAFELNRLWWRGFGVDTAVDAFLLWKDKIVEDAFLLEIELNGLACSKDYSIFFVIYSSFRF